MRCFCFRVVFSLRCFVLISLVLLFLCGGVSDGFSLWCLSAPVLSFLLLKYHISTRNQFNKRPLPETCSKTLQGTFSLHVFTREPFIQNSLQETVCTVYRHMFLKRNALACRKLKLKEFVPKGEQHLILYNYTTFRVCVWTKYANPPGFDHACASRNPMMVKRGIEVQAATATASLMVLAT